MNNPPADSSTARARYPIHHLCTYLFFRFLSRVVAVILFDVRTYHLTRFPRMDGGIISPNHCSFLDPVVVGAGMPWILSYMARDTLFRVPVFGQLLTALNTLPVVRGTNAARQGVKTSLKAVKSGRLLMIFPEGTRSSSGDLQPLKRGVVLLARQSDRPVVPVWVDGTFEIWPRHQLLPRLGPIRIFVGEPIWLDPEEGVRVGAEKVRPSFEKDASEVQDFGESSENKSGDLEALVENGWAQAGAAAGSVSEPVSVTKDMSVKTDASDKGDKKASAVFLESLEASYRALQEEARKRRRFDL